MALLFPWCFFYPSVQAELSTKAEKQRLRFIEDEKYSAYSLCADAGFTLRLSILIDIQWTLLFCEWREIFTEQIGILAKCPAV